MGLTKVCVPLSVGGGQDLRAVPSGLIPEGQQGGRFVGSWSKKPKVTKGHHQLARGIE